MKKLNEASAFAKKSPYEIYQEWEGIPVYKDFIISDLLKLALGHWDRTGGNAAFVNMDGSGGTCDAIVEEIPPGAQLKPVRHLYEKAVFVLQGQGATTIWNDGGKKHTLEWQRGSLFSAPLNVWHQHFNAQGKEPACSPTAPATLCSTKLAYLNQPSSIRLKQTPAISHRRAARCRPACARCKMRWPKA